MQSNFEQDVKSMKAEVPGSPTGTTAASPSPDRKISTSWFAVQRGPISQWFQSTLFSPGVLPSPWSHPVFGYLFAIVGQSIAITALLLLHHNLPFLHFSSALVLLTVLLAALAWGVGPSLMATLTGAILLLLLILPSSHSSIAIRLEDIIMVLPYVVVGLTISLLISLVQRERRAAQALSQRLETIIELLPDPLILYDVQGQAIRQNKSAREMGMLEEHNKPPVFEQLSRALRGEHVIDAEVYFSSSEDQSKRVFAISAAPLRSPARGNIEGAITLMHELTALHQAEQEASERARDFEVTIEALPEALYIYDTAGRVVRMNPAGRALLERAGYGGDTWELEKLHQGSFQLTFQGKQLQSKQLPTARLLSGEVLAPANAAEVTIPVENREDIRISVTGAPLQDSTGNITGAVTIYRDVTNYRHIEEALRASEGRYRTIVETANEGIWLVDKEACTLYVNKRMAQLLEWQQEELEGSMLLDYVFPEDRAAIRARIRSNLQGRAEQFEFRLRRSDGSILETLASTSPIRDATGKIVGVLSLFTDLTARKRIEEALQQSEELLHMAIRNSPIAVFQQDRELRYTWMDNPPSLTPEGIVGKTDRDFVSEEEAAHLTEIKKHVLSSGESIHQEIQIGRGEEERWELLTIEPQRDRQGAIIGLIGTSIIITERKRLEEERQRLAQQTHRALDALLTMAQVMVQEGDQGEESFDGGVSSSRQISQRLAELTRDVLGCERLSILGIEAETQQSYPLAVVGLEPEQEQFWWNEQARDERHLSEIYDPLLIARLYQREIVLMDVKQEPWNGRPNPYGVGVVLMSPLLLRTDLIGLLYLDYGGKDHDYTNNDFALIRAASRLIAVILEQGRLRIERMQAQANELAAREATRLMEEFLGIVGHELRTPLTTIKASVQLARRNMEKVKRQETSLPEEVALLLTTVRGLLERTERQVGVQNRLVSDLLDISRIQTGRLELHTEILDIGVLVRQSIEDQQSLTPERTIHIEIPMNENLLILADEDRLRQVIVNYLSNALKYSEKEKAVVARVEREADSSQVRVAVSDEGPGLSEEQQQKIWERFYRVPGIEVRSGSGVGLGLGLSISQMLIERQGGQVGVESQPGQGSTFWFTLPIAEAESNEYDRTLGERGISSA